MGQRIPRVLGYVVAVSMSSWLSACSADREAVAVRESRIAQPDSTRLLAVAVAEINSAPTWSIGPAPETIIEASDDPGPYDLYGVRDVVRLSDGRIVAAPQHGPIQIFDRQGKHLATSGRKGEGPGEYQQIMSIGRLAGDTIATFDNMLGRISLYTPGGKFIRSLSVGSLVGQFDGVFTIDGRFVGSRPVRSGRPTDELWREDLELVEIDLKDGRRTTLAPYRGRLMLGMASAPFSPRFLLAAAGTRLYASESDEFKVDVFNEHRLTASLVADLPRVPVTAEDLQRWMKADVGIRAKEDAYEAFLASIKGRAPEYHRQLSQLLGSTDGYLWIAPQQPNAEGNFHWLVLNPDGQLVAKVPSEIAGLRVRSVGPGYLVMTRWGEESLASIEVWPLIKR